MNARTQWERGLQWGALLWLGYVVFRAWQITMGTIRGELLAGELLELPLWICAVCALAPIWTAALVSVVFFPRWSRSWVVAAITAASVVGMARGSSFVPMCIPVLPLIVMRAEHPRVELALLALGRRREVLARVGGVLGGVGAALVAAALVSMNHTALEYGWILGNYGVLSSTAPATVLLTALAVLATWAAARRSCRAPTG